MDYNKYSTISSANRDKDSLELKIGIIWINGWVIITKDIQSKMKYLTAEKFEFIS